MALTIEAGRRCDSGPGSFTFETPQAEKIFSMIQGTIKQKSSIVGSNQNQEAEKCGKTQADSPLPKILDMGTPETQERTQAPITLMPLPLIPSQDSRSRGPDAGRSEVIYAEPADCIQSVPKLQPSTAQYVDPARVLPLHPPGSRQSPSADVSDSYPCINRQDSVYSEVYDKIGKAQSKHPAKEEPIYTEPMISKGQEVSHKKESKPDPFAHLYAQVHKATPSSSPTSSSDRAPTCSSKDSATDQPMDDVIYENLGII